MALEKSLSFNTDLTSEYYQIENFMYDQRANEFSVTLGFYSSQESREAGDQPLRTVSYLFTAVSIEDFEEEDILEFLYNKIKLSPTVALSDATTATDVA